MKWKVCSMGVVLFLACLNVALAGEIDFSDASKKSGDISLTPGKDLKLFMGSGPVSVEMAEVRGIHFKVEKEEMWEGFYFPNAGQATQAKTGEVYPIRYLQAEVTLANGKVLTGHLMTTVFYVESDDATEKVVVMAKQTGPDKSKLADLIYPTDIRLDAAAVGEAGSSQIDLTQAGFAPLQVPVVMVQPDLAQPPVVQAEGKAVWTVPVDDPGKLIFAVQAKDGIHVSWPMGATTDAASLADVDPAIAQAVKTGLQVMHDFYDGRTCLGSFAGVDATDIYSLVLMKRIGKSVDGGGTATPAGVTPWSLVMLRWKYDADAKKVTLLNRLSLATGPAKDGAALPAVLREPALLRDVNAAKN